MHAKFFLAVMKARDEGSKIILLSHNEGSR